MTVWDEILETQKYSGVENTLCLSVVVNWDNFDLIELIWRRLPNKGGISTHLVNIKGAFFFPSKDVKTTKKIYSSVFLLCRVMFKR